MRFFAFSVSVAIAVLVSGSAFGTAYYKSAGGSFTKIAAADLDSCSKVFYRSNGSKDLPAKHKKKYIAAKLKGETTENLDAVREAMKGYSGSCSYGDDSEKF